jgi:hypothetical protein
MANEQNLIPFNERTESEQREIRSKGGIKSGEVRREKKTLRELAEMIGQTKVSDKAVLEKLEALGLDKENFTHDMAIMMKQYEIAEKDDQKSTSAAQFIRDTKGEAPNKNEISFNGIESITINFGKEK